ncbi:baseplate J/gp47 family protein [Sporosarcina sp. FSL K6-5500]|uniref:baseplate J/gp47 family protein n=1 Tax=Sporosarcina sp. FSL K6-5500 TaxID=2921558 RepID=UPI0030F76A41
MVETEQQIHERMMYNTDDEHDKTAGSFIWDANMAAAIELSTLQEEVEYVESLMDIENLFDDELSRFVYQRTGVTHKYATRALTTVIISGQEGAIVSKGDMVSTDTVNFLSLEDRIIDATGQVSVFVSSEILGSVGNVPANSINRFPVSISGLVNVYNPEPVTNGYEAESDNELRQRYYDKLQRPGKAGNKYHYEEWAKSVTGVGDVKVLPLWNGPLTVKVVIIDSNKQPASTELVQNVFNYIESERPFGATVNVVSATGKPINVSVTLSLASGYAESSVKESIKSNITKYLSEIAFNTDYVSYAKIGNAIIGSEGVLDYSNLLVNGGTSNVMIGEEEVAIMGVI